MNLKVEKNENEATVFITGNIDIPGAEDLKKTLAGFTDDTLNAVKIDFEGVTFIGSSGIGKLLLFYKNFTAKGGSLSLVNLSDEIIALFKAIKLDKLFNL
jgi:anti-anti-sigma factor